MSWNTVLLAVPTNPLGEYGQCLHRDRIVQPVRTRSGAIDQVFLATRTDRRCPGNGIPRSPRTGSRMRPASHARHRSPETALRRAHKSRSMPALAAATTGLAILL